MSMEDLINSLPKEFENKKFNPNERGTAGLCLRWSVGQKEWHCAYGVKRSAETNLGKQRQLGIGKTARLAVEDFINKIKQSNGKN